MLLVYFYFYFDLIRRIKSKITDIVKTHFTSLEHEHFTLIYVEKYGIYYNIWNNNLKNGI